MTAAPSVETIATQLRSRRRRLRVLGAVVGAVAVVAAGLAWIVGQPSEPSPRAAAEDLATAWSGGHPEDGPVIDPSEVAESYPLLVEGLDAPPPAVEVLAVDPGEGDDEAIARIEVTWDIGSGQTFSYETSAVLEKLEGEWQAEYVPATVHPGLVADSRLVQRRILPDRADVTGGSGAPLVTARPVVHVGVEPGRVRDLGALTSTLAGLLDLDGARLADQIDAAADTAFVPVVTLRAEDYEPLRDQLLPLPGTVFREDQLPLAPSRSFARPLLGTAGEVTAEIVAERPDRYEPGDVAGLSGLQRRYDDVLAGTAGREVAVVSADGADLEVLHQEAPVPGRPVQLTIEEPVQVAAEEALASVTQPSALVAIRISDGHVLAAANGPGTGGSEIALSGRFPPGSTLKVVTTAALLEAGLDPESVVGCPPTTTVDGRSFRNAEQGALGDVAFRDAFAQSCNTSFIELASRLDDDALGSWGRRFGIGLSGDVGLGAYRGEVPTNESPVDKAAAAIGQGRNLVSPLVLADVAATVARGRHLPPTLVLAPEIPPTDEAAAEPLDPAVASTLQSLMRSVVTGGSGRALADVPGSPVHGKSGTAEYGEEDPPRTHAWFIAYSGDIAVSVLVAETEDGFGGRLAAPIAADFLRRL